MNKSHHGKDGRFHNLEPKHEVSGCKLKTIAKFSLKWLFGKMQAPLALPAKHVVSKAETIAAYQSAQAEDTMTWLGHACFIIKLNGVTILTDPFLAERAGIWKFGPKRYISSALSVNELPPVDIILLSHNHYDHLCMPTIKALPNKDKVQVIIPLGLRSYFEPYGYQHIHECDWYDEVQIGAIKITALPCVHFSRRGLFDYNKSLWHSYAIAAGQQQIYFSGDTAYGSCFKAIGTQFGSFSHAIIGIGAYSPRAVMQHSHATPEEAVQIGVDIKAATLVGMHWGTIVLSTEPAFEPPERFRQAGEKQGYRQDQLWIMAIGETRALNPDSAE